MPELNNLQDVKDYVRAAKVLVPEDLVLMDMLLDLAYTLGERNQIKEQLDKINNK
jgi:hypothetical protein